MLSDEKYEVLGGSDFREAIEVTQEHKDMLTKIKQSIKGASQDYSEDSFE